MSKYAGACGKPRANGRRKRAGCQAYLQLHQHRGWSSGVSLPEVSASRSAVEPFPRLLQNVCRLLGCFSKCADYPPRESLLVNGNILRVKGIATHRVRRDKPACCRGCKSPTGKEVANPS